MPVAAWLELELGWPPFWATTGSSVPPEPAEPGEECVGFCTDGYSCVDTQDGRRICAPICDAELSCPAGFSCDEQVGACFEVPAPPPPDLVVAGGCSVASQRPDGMPAWLFVLLASCAICTRRAAGGTQGTRD